MCVRRFTDELVQLGTEKAEKVPLGSRFKHTVSLDRRQQKNSQLVKHLKFNKHDH